MIFVTIGTPPYGFSRLIEKMDEIAGKIEEEVVMQIGHEKYKPKNAKYFDFLERFDKIKELNQKARVVVCHGGVGSIITALEQGTPVIAVPRLKKYGEENDDHQLETVTILAEEGVITAVCNVDDLESALKTLNKKTLKTPKDKKLVSFLKNYINNLELRQKILR